MIEALILIPVRANDGSRFRRRLYDELRATLGALGGGVTIAREVQGLWVGPDGMEYGEGMRPYIVVLSSWWQLGGFLTVVEWSRRAFGQEAIAVRVAGHWEFWSPQ